MKSIFINGVVYYVIRDDFHCLEGLSLEDKVTDYYDHFDYIVGDFSYGALRLKGFYRKNHNTNRFNSIDFLDTYLKEYCSYGCKWFIISKKYKE